MIRTREPPGDALPFWFARLNPLTWPGGRPLPYVAVHLVAVWQEKKNRSDRNDKRTPSWSRAAARRRSLIGDRGWFGIHATLPLINLKGRNTPLYGPKVP